MFCILTNSKTFFLLHKLVCLTQPFGRLHAPPVLLASLQHNHCPLFIRKLLHLAQQVLQWRAQTLLLNAATRIILNVEDEATVEHCVKLSGETLRGYVTEGRFEHESAVKALGYDPLNTNPIRMGDSETEIHAGYP